MTELQKAYKMVYEDLCNCELFVGIYDASHGNESFMYGVSTVMESIAYRISDEEGDWFSNRFLNNMVNSGKVAEIRKKNFCHSKRFAVIKEAKEERNKQE